MKPIDRIKRVMVRSVYGSEPGEWSVYEGEELSARPEIIPGGGVNLKFKDGRCVLFIGASWRVQVEIEVTGLMAAE